MLNKTNESTLQRAHSKTELSEPEFDFLGSSNYTPEHFSVQLKGKEYLIPVSCPHRKGRLDCGLIDKGKAIITCPLHFSKFEIPSGKNVSGPAHKSLNVVEKHN